jgi:hypothetical protein
MERGVASEGLVYCDLFFFFSIFIFNWEPKRSCGKKVHPLGLDKD